MLRKIGENLNIDSSNILAPKQALGDEEIAKRFIKLAKKIKRLAPKADDFTYFHCVMMHAAEASLIDQNTGNPILNKKGEPISGWFEEYKNNKGQDTIKWISPDEIMPYKNANGDIFSESELKKAYKKWVGRPLCKDHKSDSVDGVRGIIIDTYYNPKYKRVHALAAIDKKNYPDLARKVSTGYATAVSMGTGVQKSVCFGCGNVAQTERDYCNCVRTRSAFGEINLGLSPIELSLVVNGADPSAHVRQIVASMNEYVDKKAARISELQQDRCINPNELQDLVDSVSEIQARLKKLTNIEKSAEVGKDDLGELIAALRTVKDEGLRQQLEEKLRKLLESNDSEEVDEFEPEAVRSTSGGSASEYRPPDWTGSSTEIGINPANRLANNRTQGGKQGALDKELSLLRSKITELDKSLNELKSNNSEDNSMNSARLKARAKARRLAYWQGGGGVNEPTPGKPKYEKEDADSIRDKEDKQMVGEPLETGKDGLHPGDEEVKKKWLRAEEDEMKTRRMKRRAYWQGGGGINEPTPGKPKYEKEDSDSIRDKEDKQMVGEPLETGRDGLHPGDMETKKKWLRAKLKARFVKAADKKDCRWDFFAGDKLILTATADEIYGEQLAENWGFLSTEDYGKSVMKHIREEGFDRTAYLLKGAQDPLEAPAVVAPELPDLGTELPAPVAPEGGAKVEVKEEKGETQQKVEEALNAMEEKIAEIRDLVSEVGSEELVDIDVNVEGGGDEPAAPASPMDSVLSSKKDLLKVEALMDMSADELAEASEALDSLDDLPSNILSAVKAALKDSELILAQADDLLKSAKKKDEEEDDKEDKKDKEDKEDKDDKDDKDDKKDDEKKEAQKLLNDALRLRAENRASLVSKAMGMELDLDESCAHDEECACGDMYSLDEDLAKVVKDNLSEALQADDMYAKDKDDKKDKEDEDDKEDDDKEDKEDKDDKEDKEDEDDAMYVEESPEMVMAARKRERDSLVAQAESILGKYELDLGPASNATEPKYFDAHPGGKGTMTELTHTKTPEANVETLSEAHAVMRDVAESGPRNVRDAANAIQDAIVKGALKAEDIDQLVAEGKVDSEAASYWKKFWAQTDDSGFGADMSKEFASQKKKASDSNWRVKLRRAYDIGLEAQDKGMIDNTRTALENHVDELMKFDDAAFESYKRVVASHKRDVKSGNVLPSVGLDGDSKPIEVNANVQEVNPASLTDVLGGLDWK